ncbi:MAG: UDP-N-acetylmuramoyl-tripeptide--D-alanyl-D-alanine ligase [Lachnospira sp.]|nr:UDP-N-acetylmuramoyl-tripeptide--D-alanyl-D-alanine ligase [Lachnospira sp.]
MKGMTIGAMVNACNGRYHGPESELNKEIMSITTDSRKAEKDCLFVAIKGERSDGHDYIQSCFENGALCCMSERELPGESRPYIQVDSSLEAIKALATYYRNQLDIKVVGITGSVGKTSTKETIASVLSTKYKVLKTLGNFNNELGLPLTIFRIREDDEIAVLEMGISDFGEMSRLTAIAKPDVCVITNIGLCHLENLGTRDGVLKAKTEIFESMDSQGTAILNGDDDKLCTVKDVYGKAPVFFGINNKNAVYATDVENLGLEGMDATICGLNINSDDSDILEQSVRVHIPVAGNHMVYNACAAAAVGAVFGLSTAQIKEGIEALQTIAGRNNIIKTKSMIIVDDCYNANPVSMKASIDVIDTAKGRKVCVLGDMFELGKEEIELHYGVGEYLATKSIDILITVGTLASNIALGAKKVMSEKAGYPCSVISFDNKSDAIEYLATELKAGDNILVKASHGMHFSELVEKIKEMDA